MMLRAKIAGIFICSILTAGFATGQSPAVVHPHDFDQPTWKKIIKGIDYSRDLNPAAKEKNRDQQNSRQKRESSGPDEQPRPAPSSPPKWGPLLMKILLVVSGVIVLVVLLRALLGLGSQPANQKIVRHNIPDIDLETIEENLHESDLEKFLQKAVAEKNFPLAVRLYYLAILKELSLKSWIKWKKEKTNGDYLRETGLTPWRRPFRKATSFFEQVWYGNSPPDEAAFRQMEPLFHQLINDIRQAPQSALSSNGD